MSDVEDTRVQALKDENRRLWQWIAQHPGPKAPCDHADYSLEKHGRVCFKCGTFLTDFGD